MLYQIPRKGLGVGKREGSMECQRQKGQLKGELCKDDQISVAGCYRLDFWISATDRYRHRGGERYAKVTAGNAPRKGGRNQALWGRMVSKGGALEMTRVFV